MSYGIESNFIYIDIGLIGWIICLLLRRADRFSDFRYVFSFIDGGYIQTKASAPDYEYATTDEITIQNCHVAVFDTDGNRIHFQDFANMGDMKAIDNLSGYELGLVGVRTFGKEDKAVSVLVVANADNSLFDDCATYADYRDLSSI